MVIPNFVQQALNESQSRSSGTAPQSRAFGYVGDVVRALADLALTSAGSGRSLQHREYERNHYERAWPNASSR